MNRILVLGAICALALYLMNDSGTVQISGGKSAGSAAAGYFGASAKAVSGAGG